MFNKYYVILSISLLSIVLVFIFTPYNLDLLASVSFMEPESIGNIGVVPEIREDISFPKTLSDGFHDKVFLESKEEYLNNSKRLAKDLCEDWEWVEDDSFIRYEEYLKDEYTNK